MYCVDSVFVSENINYSGKKKTIGFITSLYYCSFLSQLPHKHLILQPLLKEDEKYIPVAGFKSTKLKIMFKKNLQIVYF